MAARGGAERPLRQLSKFRQNSSIRWRILPARGSTPAQPSRHVANLLTPATASAVPPPSMAATRRRPGSPPKASRHGEPFRCPPPPAGAAAIIGRDQTSARFAAKSLETWRTFPLPATASGRRRHHWPRPDVGPVPGQTP